jgi:hypothetical protein
MPQNYQWTPANPEIVHTGPADPDQVIPPGFIRQSAEASPAQTPEARPPDLQGVYIEPIPPPPAAPDWQSLVWRWADTQRRDSIQRVFTNGGFPAYRFEVSPSDRASSGTSGNHPRAELYSLDPAEKRRDRPAAAGSLGSLSDGDEYWATFAIYIPNSFPPNHRWATLFQRKLDDRYLGSTLFTWFTINVHQRSNETRIDASIPGYPAFTGDHGGASDDVRIRALGDIAGQWVQFTVHEKLSSGSAGTADLRLAVANKPPVMVNVGPIPNGKSFPTGDVKGHFQYGYYRDNGPAPGATSGPGTGILYYTPLLISKTGANTPPLP